MIHQPDQWRVRATSAADGRCIAMPLGGIGTGTVAIGADGGLRQWQLHNIGNHQGDLPGSLFAIRATSIEPPVDERRILQAALPGPTPPAAPLVTDGEIPSWQRQALERFGGVTDTTFRGLYPMAQVAYHDPGLPVAVELLAANPMAPLEVAISSLPVAQFTFRITNTIDQPVVGWLGATVLNAVGWDGISTITGTRGSGLGGNTNRVVRRDGWTQLLLENSTLDADAPGAGSMALAADAADVAVLAQFSDLAEFMDFLDARAAGYGAAATPPQVGDNQPHAPAQHGGASPTGHTWLGGLAARFELGPGETAEIRVLLGWHFPNRYVNFQQFGPPRPEWGSSRFYLGNHYARDYADAAHVVTDVAGRWDQLTAATQRWAEVLIRADFSETEREHLAAQAAYLRSPTCFRAADGTFFGFEGVLGASTTMWNGRFGGSCPLNCTHVWNYAQALAALFPELEQDMRRTEFEVMQHATGYLPHRVIAPTWLPQLWDVPIGGPSDPALDGMLGCVLKTWREAKRAGGVEEVRRWWDRLGLLMEYISAAWDPDDTSMLHGVQPSTHDIDLAGLNSFMGSLWIAATAAMAEMAQVMGDDGARHRWRTLSDRAARAYDAALFTGQQYRQVLEPGDPTEYQWGDGVLSDQLIGAWWAELLGLDIALPDEHVRTALRSVVEHNFKESFAGFTHGYRVFADADDAGTVICSWPFGGRPEVPTRYADEVWTGGEYQLAAHCQFVGLHEEADRVLTALWNRYDGRRRNPYNEIECGDHYARAMAGWSVIDAKAGYRFDACRGVLTVDERPDASWPLLTGTGWGLLHRREGRVDVEVLNGTIDATIEQR